MQQRHFAIKMLRLMQIPIKQSALVVLFLLALSTHAAAVPIADDASFQTPAGTQINFDLSLLVSGFTDPDFGVTSPAAHGTVVLQVLSGAVSYTPNPGYIGPDSFGYRAHEASNASIFDTGTIVLNVCPTGTCTPGPISTVVPEPSALLLVGAGIVGLPIVRKKVRR